MQRDEREVIVLLFIFLEVYGQSFPSWNVQLVARFLPDVYYSACWGWFDELKKREYFIACAGKGTYFVDITNPSSIYIADSVIGIPIQTWREAKTYKNYCYIISDDYGPSFQIIDLLPLPDSVRVVASPYLGILSYGHTLWVDGHYLYIGIPKDSAGIQHSMGIFDLEPDPENPKFLRWLDQDFPSINHIHDMYVRNDTIFASAGFQGLYVFLYDSAQNKFIYLSSLTAYPDAGYNHSSFLTKNGKTLVFTDEVPAGLSVKIVNVSNILSPQIITTFKPYPYQDFIAHNPYILGDKYLILASYQDGMLVYDISAPVDPTFIGYFDTYPQGGAHQNGVYNAGYKGNWGCYPFFPSGLIGCTDMENGIFILNASAIIPPPASIDFFFGLHNTGMYFNQLTHEVIIEPLFFNKASLCVYSIWGVKVYYVDEIKCSGEDYCSIKIPFLSPSIYSVVVSDSDNSRKIMGKVVILD